MQNELNIPTLNFSANRIVANINTCSDHQEMYYLLNSEAEIIYTGVINTYGSTVGIDISSFFFQQIHQASVSKFSIRLGSGEETITSEFYVYGSGISKLALRKYTSAQLFIEQRLHNNNTNFLLTSRTSSRVLTIPESELLPLFFYTGTVGKHFYIKNNGNVLLEKNFSTQTAETLESIDFAQLRSQILQNQNKLISVFEFFNADNVYTFSVVIGWQRAPKYILKFINSFGCYECVSINDIDGFYPQIEEEESHSVFDNIINDFTNYNKRKNLTPDYKTSINKNLYTESFIIDLLLSQNTMLIVLSNNSSYRVKISLDDNPVFSKQASTIPISLSILDSENMVTTMDNDRDYLHNVIVDNDYLSDSSGAHILTS